MAEITMMVKSALSAPTEELKPLIEQFDKALDDVFTGGTDLNEMGRLTFAAGALGMAILKPDLTPTHDERVMVARAVIDYYEDEHDLYVKIDEKLTIDKLVSGLPIFIAAPIKAGFELGDAKLAEIVIEDVLMPQIISAMETIFKLKK